MLWILSPQPSQANGTPAARGAAVTHALSTMLIVAFASLVQQLNAKQPTPYCCTQPCTTRQATKVLLGAKGAQKHSTARSASRWRTMPSAHPRRIRGRCSVCLRVAYSPLRSSFTEAVHGSIGGDHVSWRVMLMRWLSQRSRVSGRQFR